jgi:hypothetical protein
MKTRRKKKVDITKVHSGSLPVTVEMRFVRTPELVVITENDIASRTWPDVQGKFVKVSPLIKASQLHSFNGVEIRKELLEDGARVVVLAPRLIPDDTKLKKEDFAKSESVQDLVDSWFSSQHVSDEEREQAKVLLQKFMSEEGM